MSLERPADPAIRETIDDIRALLDSDVTEAALSAAETRLRALAARQDIFNLERYPLPDVGGSEGTLYEISHDPDGSYALYLSVQRGGLDPDVERRPAQPHQHNTWAIITGVAGQELNRLYRRVDGGTGPGPSKLETIEEVMIAPGTSIAMMPDGIHSAHPAGTEPSLLLLLYGMRLSDVLLFSRDGTSCSIYTIPNIA